ncbi:flagellar assembly protein FliW [Metabacillus fastidiosus]|uniref:flagellar assembly protein FliW n=1 Tax=Metabacillus fastidiosus TaxID=1458 RepID=UPI003D292882
MKIQTKYHGNIEIKQEDTILFADGIPGFEEEKQYVILDFLEDDTYKILQSINTPEKAFVITNPFLPFKQYEFELTNESKKILNIEKSEDVLTYVILTINDPISESTANLQAPLIINLKNNKAKQIVLNDSTYTTKHYLFNNKSSTCQEVK